MPGKKSLKKMEKSQEAEPEKKEEKKKEKIVGSVNIMDSGSAEVMDALRKMKAITPPAVASQFNLKTSVAKKMLEELRVKGQIDLVSQSSNLKVYAMAKHD